MFGFYSGNQLQTSNSLSSTVNGYSICYYINFSPSIYFIEQDYKQTLLNFIAQIASLTSITIFFFTLFYYLVDRINQYIISKREGKEILTDDIHNLDINKKLKSNKKVQETIVDQNSEKVENYLNEINSVAICTEYTYYNTFVLYPYLI